MPQLIKPNDVKIFTKDGEIKVSISLDININQNQNQEKNNFDKKENNNIIEDKTHWEIPDFNSKEIINFGKEKK